jgi:hypothetical protein
MVRRKDEPGSIPRSGSTHDPTTREVSLETHPHAAWSSLSSCWVSSTVVDDAHHMTWRCIQKAVHRQRRRPTVTWKIGSDILMRSASMMTAFLPHSPQKSQLRISVRRLLFPAPIPAQARGMRQ